MITDLIKDDKQRSKKRERSVQQKQISLGNDKQRRKKRKSEKYDRHPPDASKSKKRFYSKHRFLFTKQGKLGFHVGSICSEDDTYMPLLNRVEPSSLAKKHGVWENNEVIHSSLSGKELYKSVSCVGNHADHLCWRFSVCTTFQSLMTRNHNINH